MTVLSETTTENRGTLPAKNYSVTAVQSNA